MTHEMAIATVTTLLLAFFAIEMTISFRQNRKNAISANKRLSAMWELEAISKALILKKEKTL